MIPVTIFQITEVGSEVFFAYFFAYFQHLRRNTFHIVEYLAFRKTQVGALKAIKTFIVYFE